MPARLLVACRKQLKTLMEHATQFPEEYSKISSVQKKVGGVQAQSASSPHTPTPPKFKRPPIAQAI